MMAVDSAMIRTPSKSPPSSVPPSALTVAPVMLVTRPQDLGTPFELLVSRPARFVFADPLGSH